MIIGRHLTIVLVLAMVSLLIAVVWVQTNSTIEGPPLSKLSIEDSTAPSPVDRNQTVGVGPNIAESTKIVAKLGLPNPSEELARLGIDSSLNTLRAVLSDPEGNSDTRYWSAMLLGMTGTAEDGDLLIQMASPDQEHDVRMGAIAGLVHLDEEDHLRVLQDYLSYDADEAIRLGVVSAIYRNMTEAGQEIVINSALDTSQLPFVRLHSATVLAENTSASIENTMRVLLVDEVAELRATAAVSLARKYSDEVTPQLVKSAIEDELSIDLWDQVRRELQIISDFEITSKPSIEYVTNPEARIATNREIREWWAGVRGAE